MGVRIGQDPFDALVIQEMLHDVKPDLIIETGTNSGGGALYMAVMMEAINPACKIFTMDTTPIEAWMKRFDGREQGGQVSTKRIAGGEAEDEESEVLQDPRHHPMWKKRVTFALGKSTDRRILRQIKNDFLGYESDADGKDYRSPKRKTVLVVLDSDHSSGTVLSELINYAPFVTLGSYILVEDTVGDHRHFQTK